MIFNVSGGGGTALNFRVVGGTTAPSNPKENMIWVNTSTKITSYIFSATQHTGSAGMVWISTGKYSTVAFNALKKNGIQVYPLSAKQYVGGAWIEKNAMIYQNGKWAGFDTIVLSSDIDNTGGWSWYNSGSGASAVKNSDGSWTLTRGNASTSGYLFRTNNTFDLTEVKTLEFEIPSHGNSSDNMVGVVPSKTDSAIAVSGGKSITASGTFQLDVSGFSGQYAVATNMSYTNGSLKIANIKLLR